MDVRTTTIVALALICGLLAGALLVNEGEGPRSIGPAAAAPQVAAEDFGPLVLAIEELVGKIDMLSTRTSGGSTREIVGVDSLALEIARLREALESNRIGFGGAPVAASNGVARGSSGIASGWEDFVSEHRAVDPNGAATFLARFGERAGSNHAFPIELFETHLQDVVAIFGEPSTVSRSAGSTYVRFEFDEAISVPGLTDAGVGTCEFTFDARGRLVKYLWVDFYNEDE